MSIYKMFSADEDLERKGVTIDFGECSFDIARAGGSNALFHKTLEQLSKPHKHALQREMLDDKIAIKLLATVYARAVIIGWQGVSNKHGEPLECTEANIITVLTDLPELFTAIQQEAGRITNFQIAEELDDLKN